MSMFRRRLMMQTQSGNMPKIEYIYNPADGIYPEQTGEWTFKPGTYYNSNVATNKRNLGDGLLNTLAVHMYSTQCYYPINKTADKCEIEIHVNSATVHKSNGLLCCVCLTDGEYFVLVGVDKSRIRVSKNLNQRDGGNLRVWEDLFNTNFDSAKEPFVLRVTKDNNEAFVYLNEELIYTRTGLFLKSILPDTSNYSVIASKNELYNTVRFGGASTSGISKMIYREW